MAVWLIVNSWKTPWTRRKLRLYRLFFSLFSFPPSFFSSFIFKSNHNIIWPRNPSLCFSLLFPLYRFIFFLSRFQSSWVGFLFFISGLFSLFFNSNIYCMCYKLMFYLVLSFVVFVSISGKKKFPFGGLCHWSLPPPPISVCVFVFIFTYISVSLGL